LDDPQRIWSVITGVALCRPPVQGGGVFESCAGCVPEGSRTTATPTAWARATTPAPTPGGGPLP